MTGSDVVVVGSGAAGLAGALSAATCGARVTVFEKASVLGGTTAISGGGMWLPGNPFMAAAGAQENAADVKRYLRALTVEQDWAEPVVDSYIENSPRVFDLFADKTAVELEATDTPDYQSHLPGGRLAGRQIAVGLFDSNRLGEYKLLLREPPLVGGTQPIRHSELAAKNWEIGAIGQDWVEVANERRRQGIVGRGRALVGALVEACLEHDVTFVVDAPVSRLLVRDGRVTGVVVQLAGKEVEHGAAAGVLLASGGFEWDRDLWRRLVGMPLDFPLSPPTNSGDGLRMAMSAGSMIGNPAGVHWVPGVRIEGELYDEMPRARGAHLDKGRPGAIVVNPAGRRFGNETMNYNDFGLLMTRFDAHSYSFSNLPAHVILDSRHLERYPILLWQDKKNSAAAEWLRSADTPRDLAAKIGVDPGGLEAQLQEFNRHAEHGEDPSFLRGHEEGEAYKGDKELENPSLAPLDSPPYYAYELKLTCFGTKGGPVTDEHARVIGGDSTPIPGLYAAGNVAASLFGRSYPGAGATIGPAVVFGYAAGQSMAA
jgi:succinate dehydrogenase/fumarate reductase flavoprotein subunit